MLKMTSPGADFSSSLDYIAAVPDGLEYLNFFKGGSDTVLRNLAPNKPKPTMIGLPTYGPGYATFKGLENFIQTQVSEPVDFTIIAAARTRDFTPSSRPIYVGNFTDTEVGLNLFQEDATHPILAVGGLGGASVAAPEGAFSAISARGAGTAIDITDLTRNVRVSQSLSGDHVPTANKMRVGSGFGSFVGFCDISFVAIYSRALSDGELLKMHAAAKYVAALDGISI